jgi:phage shock protein A
MYHVAIQIRELVTTNVSHIVKCATNPARMAKQLRKEIEDAIIALGIDQVKAARRAEALAAEAAQLELKEADWHDKAATALGAGREDLARTALDEREKVKERIAAKRQEAALSAAEAAELAEAVTTLEGKLEEVRGKIADMEREHHADFEARRAASASGPVGSAAERKLDRISVLEQRVAFAASEPVKRATASVEAEIDALAREKTIISELEALRKKFKGK